MEIGAPTSTEEDKRVEVKLQLIQSLTESKTEDTMIKRTLQLKSLTSFLRQ